MSLSTDAREPEDIFASDSFFGERSLRRLGEFCEAEEDGFVRDAGACCGIPLRGEGRALRKDDDELVRALMLYIQ